MKKIFEKRFCIYEIFKLFITRRIHFIKVLFSKKKEYYKVLLRKIYIRFDFAACCAVVGSSGAVGQLKP